MLLRLIKISSLSLVAMIAAIGIYMGINQISGNFHEVIPGELYRSAQPGSAVIDEAVKRYGIKTIVNLRNERHAAGTARKPLRPRRTV